MAEKEAKKPDAAPAAAKPGADDKKHAGDAKPAAAAKGGGLLTKTPVLLGGVMLLEAVVLFAGFKFIIGSGPKGASADVVTTESTSEHGGGEGGHGEGGEGGEKKVINKSKLAEVPVVEFRAPNKQSGRTFIYDVSIVVITKTEDEPKVKDLIASRKALITDRVRTIIAQTEPEKLEGGSEPNLDTLRRQVKCQLDEVVGEGLIQEVLIPRCIPFRTDY